MNKFINTVKTLEPTPLIALVLTFAVGLIVGQQTTTKSEVEVVYHNPYKALTLDECVTDWECETAQLIADNRDGKLVRTDDPIFFPDSIPVIEPLDYEQGESPSDYEQGESPSDCEANDTECEKTNKQNAGKPAHYPAFCEPYIFTNEYK